MPDAAANVPGYAGTALPERGLTASGMEDAARARLADPDDPGGRAGRTVIEGTTLRPAASITVSDPAVARGKRIAADPQASAHRADGLASGGTAACGAELDDAGDGGSCGGVRYCVGAGCETVRSRSNTGFVEATSRLNMAIELGGEKFDREDMRFFKGTRRACTIRLFGLANCCRNDGLLEGLAGCSASERELARERHDGNTHYLGKRCAKKTFFGVCIRREKVWCTFGSKLGRILQEQGRKQLGRGWGDCRGLTVAEIESIDFARPRPLGIHREPDGRGHGARCLAAGFGRHRGCDADPHPRLLQPGPVMARASRNTPRDTPLQRRASGLLLAVAGAQPGLRQRNGGRGVGRRVPALPSAGISIATGTTAKRKNAPCNQPRNLRHHRRANASWRCGASWRKRAPRRSSIHRRRRVAAYLRLQQETLQRAAAFSDAFRRTVWATPELDYTLKRPVGALAKRLWSDDRRAAVAASLARLGERYGLIYLGHTGCGGCRVFGPLLRAFAQRYGLDVLAVSLTGGPLEGWPEAVPDNGRAAKLGLAGTPVPAVVLFDTQTKKVLPVGFGVMAEDQLAERIFTLTALEPGNDY